MASVRGPFYDGAYDGWRSTISGLVGPWRQGEIMNSFLNTIRSNTLAQAVVSLLFGLFLLVWPGATIITVVYLMAAWLAVSGIASLVSYFRDKSDRYRNGSVLAVGVFYLVLALIVFIFPEPIASVGAVVLGVVLVLCGVVSLVRALELKPLGGYQWILGTILSALVAIGGVLIITNPFGATSAFVMVLGIVLIVNGAVNLYVSGELKRLAKNIAN